MRDFATGYQATPSAWAMRAFWEQHPWVPEMQAELRRAQAELRRAQTLHTYVVYVYRSADRVGSTPCYKCGGCLLHRLWEIRAKYDPEVADLAP